MKKKTRSKAKRPAKPVRSTRKASSVQRFVNSGGAVAEKLKSVRFAGVSIGGGKTDKTSVAVIEYFPEMKRVFLRSLRDKVSAKGEITADEALLEILNLEEQDVHTVAFDAPLQLPVSIRACLGGAAEKQAEEQVLHWMRDMHRKRAKEKRPNKMFTSYTERASEIYISHELEEEFHPSHALGANAAPLTARAIYLSQQIKKPLIEVYPKLSLWRIGRALDIPKSYLRFHRHAVDSDEARLYILKTLIEKEIAFVYQQDLKLMVEHNVVFEAFLCALTAFLKYRGQTEKRPHGFPKEEAWIDFPLQKIRWFT